MTPEQENNLRNQIYRAGRAKEVLENEAYIDAFALIEKELVAKWKEAPVRDKEGREHAWLMQHMLSKVQECLAATMDSGKLATRELEHQRTLIERAKDWL